MMFAHHWVFCVSCDTCFTRTESGRGPKLGGVLSTIAFFMEKLLLGPGYARLPSEVTVMSTLNPQWITDRISYSWGMRKDKTEGHTLYQLRYSTKACNYFHNNKQ